MGWGWGWGPWGALGSKGSAPCRNDTRASREFGGSKPDGACKQVGGYARSVDEWWPKSADLRFGVLDHVGGEARGEVYLPPTPLRRGGRCLPAANPSEGSVEEAKPLGGGGRREKMTAAPSCPVLFSSNLDNFEKWAQTPRRGWLMSPGGPKPLPRVLGHHLAANPSEGLVEEARMTRMWSLGPILGHLEPNAV